MKLRINQVRNKGMKYDQAFSPVDDQAAIRLGREIVATSPIMSLIDQATRTLDRGAILAIAGQIAEHTNKKTVCRDGCSHCCYMAVSVSTFEAQRISEFTGRSMATLGAVDDYVNNFKVEDYATVPCTFLVDNKCSIYPVRPLGCRLHHNLADSADVCKVSFPIEEMASTPSLDFNNISFWFANLTLRAKEGFGDIREFFPK